MTIGDPSKFAIESGLTKAYQRLSFRGLGYFVLHIGGQSYGVHEPDATLLALAYDDVGRRIAERGKHLAPFAKNPDAFQIMSAVQHAWSESKVNGQEVLGMPKYEFLKFFESKAFLRCVLDRLYDEAFEDGSRILHFDIQGQVRLIACRFKAGGQQPDAITLSDVWLPADEFYRILAEWHRRFEAEWLASEKVAESA